MFSMQRPMPFAALLLCSLAGCPTPATTNDAASTADARGASDAFSVNDAFSASDAFVASDAGQDAFVARDAFVEPGAVATCQARVDAMIARCEGDSARVCLWRGYRELCTQGNTALLNSALACFSGGTFCRSFSDPNEAESCLTALGPSIPMENVSYMNGVISRCGGTPFTPTGATEIFPYVNANSLTDCTGSACTIDAIVMACSASLPSFTCGG